MSSISANSIAASGIFAGRGEINYAARNVAISNAVGSIGSSYALYSQGPHGGVRIEGRIRDDVNSLELNHTGRDGDVVVPNESRNFFVFSHRKDEEAKFDFLFGRTASFDLDQDGFLKYQGRVPLGFEVDNMGRPIGQATSFQDLKELKVDRNSLSPAEVVSNLDVHFRFDAAEAPVSDHGHELRSDVLVSDPLLLKDKSILIHSIREVDGSRNVKREEFSFSGFEVSSLAYTATDISAGAKLLEVDGVDVNLADAIVTTGATPDSDFSAMQKIVKSINASGLINASIVDDGTNKKLFLGTDSQQSVDISNVDSSLGFTANFSINASPPGRTRFSSMQGLGKLLSNMGLSVSSKEGFLKILPSSNSSISITNSSSNSDVLSLFGLGAEDQGFINIAYSAVDQRYSLNRNLQGAMGETVAVIDPEGGRRLINVVSNKIGADRYISEVSLSDPSSSGKLLLQSGIIELGENGQISNISSAPSDIFANTTLKFSNESFAFGIDTPPGEIYVNGKTLIHGANDDIAAGIFNTPHGLAQLVEKASGGDIKATFLANKNGDIVIRFRLSRDCSFSDNQGGAMLSKLGMPRDEDLRKVDVIGRDEGSEVEWDSITSQIQNTNLNINISAEKSSGINQRIRVQADGRAAGEFRQWYIDESGRVKSVYSNGAEKYSGILALVEQRGVAEWEEADSGFYKGIESTMDTGTALSFSINILTNALGNGGTDIVTEMMSLNRGSILSSVSSSALKIFEDTQREVVSKMGS